MRTLRWLPVIVALVPAVALAEPPAWWPQESVVQVTVERPAAALAHPLVRDVSQAIAETPLFQVEQKAVDRLKLNQARELIETSLGQPWPTAIDSLVTRAWFGIALPAGVGQQPEAILVIEAHAPEVITKFLSAGRDLLAKQNPPVVPQARQAGNHQWFQLGDAGYAQIGPYLLTASRTAALEKLLTKADALPANASIPEAARVELNVDLEKLGTIPQFSKGLQWPTNNGGLVVTAGGYVELLRRANTARATLTFEGESIALDITADAGTDGLPPALAGFFTTGESPAPPLQIADMLASVSWVRDYAPLWTHRADLITADALAPAEKEYEKHRARNGFGLDEVTAWLGTRWRFVVARQNETVYRRQPSEKLPVAALVVSLRDETAFTEKVFTFLDKSARGPVTLVFGYPKSTEYAGAKITSVRIKEPEGASEIVDYRYSVSPAMTVAHGHFIVGSTEEIVHQVIDELARQQAVSEAPRFPAGTTDVQHYSFRDAARLVGEFRETILRRIVLEGGLTVAEGEKNTDAVAKILERLGELRSTTIVTGREFRTEIRLGR